MLSAEDREVIRRAENFYEERLKSDLEKNHLDEFVVIIPEAGEFFLGKTMNEAARAARAAHPGKRGHMMRVGHEAAVHIGAIS